MSCRIGVVSFSDGRGGDSGGSLPMKAKKNEENYELAVTNRDFHQ